MLALVVNAGSQSVKLRVVDDEDALLATADLGPPDAHLAKGLADFLERAGRVEVSGHRVVHGGSRFTESVVVSDEVRRGLAALDDLAPLHNPPALAGIDALRRLRPDLPAVACFDTAFHAALPAAAATYALPVEWEPLGIRRYGFHGLSCAWAVRRAAAMLDRPVEDLRVIVCHLGGGASVTAVAGGRSQDTTMGFTPLEGLVMATRCGDLDPGALLWVLQRGPAVAAVSDDLEHRAGLLGLSGGRTNDTRDLLAMREDGDEQAALAVAVYCHRIRAKVASMAAATSGTDVIIFTGGVGEHSARIRAEVCGPLRWLGVAADDDLNDSVADADLDISEEDAKVRTLVVHAREELEIARECRRLVN